MPGKTKSPVLKMAQLMASMDPEVKDTVMAIVNQKVDHPAVQSVAYFAGLSVPVARAILDIIVTEVNARDEDYKKPGRPAGKVKTDGAPPPSPVAAAPGPSPVAEAAQEPSQARRARK